MTLSVILPTYNEKDNIIEIIEKIVKSIGNISCKYQIVVVDDNSPDKTGEICRKYFYKNKQIIIYIRKKEKGFASAIYFGIKKSKGDTIIVMDTDFSHDPALIPIMISKMETCDIVIGSRYAKNGGGEDKKRYLLSKIYNFYLKSILKIEISDFLFGYFCVRKTFLIKKGLLNKNIFTGFGDYFIRLAYYINKSGGTFLEIPAFYKSRIHGTSKSDLKKMLFTYTKTSLQLLLRNLYK
ncbi:MAG: glycosyltransferase [Patescibacteria group bacterium]|nr:glycosyltransferase [Patescibacteria group bacterium]